MGSARRHRIPPRPIARTLAEQTAHVVEHEVAWAREHHGKLRFEGGTARAVCSCGWMGDVRAQSETAAVERELEIHRAT